MAEIKDNSMDNPGDNVHFFEGVEKLLEICFTNSKGLKQHESDLRQIPRYYSLILSSITCSISPVLSSCESDDSRRRPAKTDDDDHDKPRRRQPFNISYVDHSHSLGRCSIHAFVFAYSARDTGTNLCVYFSVSTTDI